MLMLFTCEHCGKRIKVDARMQGRKGRCSNCGQAMRIPRADEPHPPPLPAAEPAHAAGPRAGPRAHRARHRPPDAPFQLSPPEPRPEVGDHVLPPAAGPDRARAPAPARRRGGALRVRAAGGGRSARGRRCWPRPRSSGGSASSRSSRRTRVLTSWRTTSTAASSDGPAARGPAGWVYTRWRKGVGLILKGAPLHRRLGVPDLDPLPHPHDLRRRHRAPRPGAHRRGRRRAGQLRAVLDRPAGPVRPAVQGGADPRPAVPLPALRGVLRRQALGQVPVRLPAAGDRRASRSSWSSWPMPSSPRSIPRSSRRPTSRRSSAGRGRTSSRRRARALHEAREGLNKAGEKLREFEKKGLPRPKAESEPRLSAEPGTGMVELGSAAGWNRREDVGTRRLTMPVGGITMDVEPRAETADGRPAKGRRLAWIAIGAIALAVAAVAGFLVVPRAWFSGRGPRADGPGPARGGRGAGSPAGLEGRRTGEPRSTSSRGIASSRGRRW